MEYTIYYTYPVQIRFNDIDLLGHVTNSAYPQYFDLGRMAYFNAVLKEQMDWQQEGLILVSIQIDFKSQIILYDKVLVRTKVVRLGNKSLTMLQELINETTGSVAATSMATMVAYSSEKGESIVMPGRWRQRIMEHEQDVNFQE